MESNYAIVDFQGFKDNSNRFIVKEFALITKNLKFHDIIKSPAIILDEKHERQAEWLTKNYHGLDRSIGHISLTELHNTIHPILMNKTVYVKGEEKVKWMQYILSANKKINIINLETINCLISLHKKNIRNKFYACKNHQNIENKKNRIYHCAMENVSILNDWRVQMKE